MMMPHRDNLVLTAWEPAAEAQRGAFTLVELLAICIVLALAATLVLPALMRAQQRSIQASCQANLRQMGAAVQTFTADNNGRLPGPLFPLAAPLYDQASSNQLTWFIAGNLSLALPSSAPVLVPQLLCPASNRAGKDEHGSQADYVLNDGSGIAKLSSGPPFGQTTAPVLAPLNLSRLAACVAPSACWAIADADKGDVNPRLAGWNSLAYHPVHGPVRNQLYFDWHVAAKAW